MADNTHKRMSTGDLLRLVVATRGRKKRALIAERIQNIMRILVLERNDYKAALAKAEADAATRSVWATYNLTAPANPEALAVAISRARLIRGGVA